MSKIGRLLNICVLKYNMNKFKIMKEKQKKSAKKDISEYFKLAKEIFPKSLLVIILPAMGELNDITLFPFPSRITYPFYTNHTFSNSSNYNRYLFRSR